MAIDPNILLQRRGLDLGSVIGQIGSNVGRFDAIQQNRELSEQRKQQAQQTQLDARDKSRIISLTNFAQEVLPDLTSDNPEGALKTAQDRLARMQKTIADNPGIQLDTTETEQFIEMLQTPEGQLRATDLAERAVRFGQQQGILGQGSKVQSSQFIPGVGFATLSRSGEASLIPVEGVGETASQKRILNLEKTIKVEQQKQFLQGKTSAVKAAVTKGAAAFDKIAPLTLAISNYGEAIAAIDSGAETGVVESMLPSFRTSSIELDNIVKRLGLDVVGNTTFGALSESELKFALDAAIPTKLQPQELKQWLIAKRTAQQKVKERVEEAASFLSDGTHTIKDWIVFDQARQLNAQNQTQQPQEQPTQPQQQAQPTATATGPNGEKLGLINGQWVRIDG